MNVTDIVKFQTNIAEEFSFAFEDGREVEGRFGTQYFRQTTDGRGVYLQPFVEQRLLELEIKPGERVSICKAETKDGRKKGIRWEVKRVDPPAETAATPSPGQPGQPAKITPAPQRTTVEPNVPVHNTTPRMPAQRAQPAPPQPVQTASTAAQPDPFIEPAPKPILHTQASMILKSCLMAAIDAARDAQIYAATAGFPLVFGPDQVEAMAISLYIQMSKQSNINLMNRNQNLRATNGGTEPWQH